MAMPNNSDYWRHRAEITEAMKNRNAGNYTAAVERQFNLAQKTLDEQIEQWYGRFAKNNQITLVEARQWLTGKDLAEFKWDVNEYIKYGKDAQMNPAFIKQLENASARFHISKLEGLKLKTQNTVEQLYGQTAQQSKNLFGKIYAESYYHTAFQLQQGIGVGWDITALNSKQIEAVLSKPWTLDNKTFSDRLWAHKQNLLSEVHTQLTQNMLLGNPPGDAISTISKKFNASKSNAGRLVMTESAYFSNEAQKKVYADLDVEEVEVVGTLDGETCRECGSLDGTHFPMAQYEVGVTAPPFHPWCRCCTAPYFTDLSGERFARDEENGKGYYVPADMTYTKWKSIYVDKTQPPRTTKTSSVENRTKGLINNTIGGKITAHYFTKATSIEEANDYAKNTLGIQNASYKGVDVDTANEWNKGLTDTFNRFPELKNEFGFVGECHERNAMLKPTVRQYYLDELIKLNPSTSVKVLEPYADKHTKNFMRSMSVGKKTMAESWSPSHGAFSEFKGITVNKDYGKNTKSFIETLKQQVAAKAHPVGCDTIRSVLDHEIGHQLDDLLEVRKMPSIQKVFDTRTPDELTNAISSYAWNNSNANKYAEMIAEAWAEYCNNPSPREIAKTVGEAIESAYKVKFNAP